MYFASLACASVVIGTASVASAADGRWTEDYSAPSTTTYMRGEASDIWAERPPMTTVSELLLAQSDDSDDDGVNDPLEPVNRFIFDINEFIYDILLRPLSYAYNDYVHEHIRYLLGNVFETISAPVTLANDILQLEPERAGHTLVRIGLNAVFGFGGMVDLAEEFGVEQHSEDFGQTLAVWGVGEGFYVVLPIFGPSSPRDAVGKFFVDGYFSPFNYWVKEGDHPRDTIGVSVQLGGGLHQFAGVVNELDDVKKTSIDYYAAVRSLYRQKRASEIANGESIDLPPIPDLGYELDLDDTEDDSETGGIEEQQDPFGAVYQASTDSPVDAGGHGLESLIKDAMASKPVEVAERPVVKESDASSF